jgi:hypothetical protein
MTDQTQMLADIQALRTSLLAAQKAEEDKRFALSEAICHRAHIQDRLTSTISALMLDRVIDKIIDGGSIMDLLTAGNAAQSVSGPDLEKVFEDIFKKAGQDKDPKPN